MDLICEMVKVVNMLCAEGVQQVNYVLIDYNAYMYLDWIAQLYLIGNQVNIEPVTHTVCINHKQAWDSKLL